MKYHFTELKFHRHIIYLILLLLVIFIFYILFVLLVHHIIFIRKNSYFFITKKSNEFPVYLCIYSNTHSISLFISYIIIESVYFFAVVLSAAVVSGVFTSEGAFDSAPVLSRAILSSVTIATALSFVIFLSLSTDTTK